MLTDHNIPPPTSMAEDDGKGSGRSRFKSKWGKIIKNTEQLKNASDSFSKSKGNEANSQADVDDFLKPSVERAAANRPRLDVSIAQRWPDPNEVRQAGAFPEWLAECQWVEEEEEEGRIDCGFRQDCARDYWAWRRRDYGSAQRDRFTKD